jgi:hypothetical protein
VTTFDVLGIAGVGTVPGDDKPMTVVEVLVMLIVDPPDNVLVSLVQILHVKDEPRLLAIAADVRLLINVEDSVVAVMVTMEILLDKVAMLFNVVGRTRLGKAPGGGQPKTIVEALVNVDVISFGGLLVGVIGMREVASCDGKLEVPSSSPPDVVAVILVRVVL